MPRQRIEPSAAQVTQARKLLDAVPTQIRRYWSSPAGDRFMAYVADLQEHGVPVMWIAPHLGLNPEVLMQQISRWRAEH